MQENAQIDIKIKIGYTIILKRRIEWFKHLFGFHHSSCRWAGKWNMNPNRKVRGPFCSVTNMPLLLPKNRNR